MKIFITGGTSGIGLQLALDYLSDGHVVGICGRDLSKLSEKIKNHENLKTYQADVRDVKKMSEIIFEFSQGQLDLLIANAGISLGHKSSKPNIEKARVIIDTYVHGLLNAVGPALELMLKNSQGHIAIIASVAGYVGLPGAAAYSASKAAALKFGESLSLDLQDYGIFVTTVAPGFIKTPLTDQNKHSMPFLMDVQKASKIIINGIEAKKVLLVFPFRMWVVIEILSRLPRWLYRKIMKVSFFNYSAKGEN